MRRHCVVFVSSSSSHRLGHVSEVPMLLSTATIPLRNALLQEDKRIPGTPPSVLDKKQGSLMIIRGDSVARSVLGKWFLSSHFSN